MKLEYRQPKIKSFTMYFCKGIRFDEISNEASAAEVHFDEIYFTNTKKETKSSRSRASFNIRHERC